MSSTVQENNSAYPTIITACVIFGMIGTFVKDIQNMGAGSIQFYRLFFGFAVLLPYLVAMGTFKELHLRQKKGYVLFLGVINTITAFSYFTAIKYTSIQVAVMLLYTAPVYVTLLSPFILKEKITPQGIFSLLLSISGIMLAANPASLGGELPGNSFGEDMYFQGLCFGLLSGFSYSCSIMTINYLKADYSAAAQIFWSVLVSLVLLLPFGASVPGTVLLENLRVLVPFGIIATAFGSLLYLSGAVRIRAQTAAVLSLLEPVSSILFGCTLLGEPIQKNTIEGCSLILAGAFLASCRTPRWPKIISKKHFWSIRTGFFQPLMPPRPGKL